jgi:hypothetical protein
LAGIHLVPQGGQTGPPNGGAVAPRPPMALRAPRSLRVRAPLLLSIRRERAWDGLPPFPTSGNFSIRVGGSVRRWATDEPRSGCTQAPGLCAGQLSRAASDGGGAPPPCRPQACPHHAKIFARRKCANFACEIRPGAFFAYAKRWTFAWRKLVPASVTNGLSVVTDANIAGGMHIFANYG